ncbi:MAG: radical SAM protein [Thermodesulfobacteriota bacterium]|nr:radical SAM protein [Thermodesulfobacteriota bacterium]
MVPYKPIYLGSSCNNSCLYCNTKTKGSQPEILELSESLLHNDPVDSIELYGGEPLIKKDFFSILDTARNRGYKRIKLVTNARACADINTAVRIIEFGCYLYEVKIHHFRADVHDFVTQARGSLQESVQGLANLRRINTLHNTPFSAFISLRIALSKKNIEDLSHIILAFVPYRIDRFILSFDDNELELSRALPHIKNAIDLSILNRVWVITKKIPPCCMRGFEHHVSELYQFTPGEYRKPELCKSCPLNETCHGLTSSYADTCGFNDLLPFDENDPMVEDIRNVTHDKS